MCLQTPDPWSHLYLSRVFQLQVTKAKVGLGQKGEKMLNYKKGHEWENSTGTFSLRWPSLLFCITTWGPLDTGPYSLVKTEQSQGRALTDLPCVCPRNHVCSHFLAAVGLSWVTHSPTDGEKSVPGGRWKKYR